MPPKCRGFLADSLWNTSLGPAMTKALAMYDIATSAQLAYGCADGVVMSYAQMYRLSTDVNFLLCSVTRYSAPCVFRMLHFSVRNQHDAELSQAELIRERTRLTTRSWLADSEHLSRANIFALSGRVPNRDLVLQCSQFVATQPTRALNATEQGRWLSCVHGNMDLFALGSNFLRLNASLSDVRLYCSTLLAVKCKNIARIELIEDWPCSSLQEAKAREAHWIATTVGCVNKNLPNQSRKGYKERQAMVTPAPR